MSEDSIPEYVREAIEALREEENAGGGYHGSGGDEAYAVAAYAAIEKAIAAERDRCAAQAEEAATSHDIGGDAHDALMAFARLLRCGDG